MERDDRPTTVWQLGPGTPPILVYTDEVRLLELDATLHENVFVYRNAAGVCERLDPATVSVSAAA